MRERKIASLLFYDYGIWLYKVGLLQYPSTWCLFLQVFCILLNICYLYKFICINYLYIYVYIYNLIGSICFHIKQKTHWKSLLTKLLNIEHKNAGKVSLSFEQYFFMKKMQKYAITRILAQPLSDHTGIVPDRKK